jgi:CheY-like chemotaxis protein
MNESPAVSAAKRDPILVAEDDPEVRMLMCAFLHGVRPVLEASDGQQALELIRQHRPALIVCDSEMPGLRARDVIARMRRDASLAQTPFIVTSGFPEAEVLDRDTPVAAFLPKPFTGAELVELVARTLAKAA